METDQLGTAFHFPDLGQVPLGTKTRSQELLASLLDTEEAYNSCFTDQLPDLHMLDDDFFQFASVDFGADPLSSLLPRSGDSTHDTFLHDIVGAGVGAQPAHNSSSSDDAYHPTLPDSCFSEAPNSNSSPVISDSNMFLVDDIYLVAPNDSFDGETLSASAVAAASSLSFTAISTPPESEGNDAAGGAVPDTALSFQEEEEGEEEEEETEKDPKPGTATCKNLVSERNRRKRLSQQLLALRALVPNITKMDKRSVLVDALAYLRSIHEETARIQAELKERARSSREPCGDNDPDPNQPQLTPAPARITKPKAKILEVDTEKIEERRFVVKIICKGESGVGAEVLRVMESIGFEITYTAIEQLKPQHVLTTVFIRVRRQGRMTEDKLKDCITSTALRFGLTLDNP
ncbi:transcription factor FER-LIKE IRON DEFICIENCY-INDUCED TRANSCRIPTION FACTOR-like [Aristolochia californica]|uniref:transcription factor FER-LIKE IRON DEFICIENCY-INDUCED TRANSCRIPTION FACTOR-like n=1 Tax=Aristolochia californica TaxID=171875 RepID=UPI0035E15126